MKEEEGSRVRKRRNYTTDFVDGGRVHESNNTALEARKGVKTNSLLLPPESVAQWTSWVQASETAFGLYPSEL